MPDYRFKLDLSVRDYECDMQGIVFNAHWYALLDDAVGALWRERLGGYDRISSQGIEIVVAEPCEHARQRPAHAGFAHEARVAVGGEGEARRHAHAGVDQLAERRALAADQRDVLLADFLEPVQLRG